MTRSMDQAVTLQPRMHVDAMASIVRDLVVGGMADVRTKRWLVTRAAAAGLTEQETSALEALRLRLCACGATMLDAVTALTW